LRYEAVPSAGEYGLPEKTVYREDIFVGYRWYETFARQDVLFPFGFGLTYTSFSIRAKTLSVSPLKTDLSVTVTNVGKLPGKCSVQCYADPPVEGLGKPARILADYHKTDLLLPAEEESFTLSVRGDDIASFDEEAGAFVLDAGEYIISVGENIRDVAKTASLILPERVIVKKTAFPLPVRESFERIIRTSSGQAKQQVPARSPFPEEKPAPLPRFPKDGKTLADVRSGRITLEEFVGRFSDEDLRAIVIGEGTSSPKGAPGASAVFGGVTSSLSALGLPVICCSDGPSGLKLGEGIHTTAYPSALCQAAMFSDSDLLERCYETCGREYAFHGVDLMLGPGVNIHRNPLCGRNFEYFSEDPLLAGRTAAAVCRGLARAGVGATIKHFLANSQEPNREEADSVLSERALREIYGKVFEICIANAPVPAVMSSYNRINGVWSATSYDTIQRLLKKDYGFNGFVMTDWWANLTDEEGHKSRKAYSQMVRCGNDIYMVIPDVLEGDNDLAEKLSSDELLRAALQQSALRICAFALKSLSFKAGKGGKRLANPKAACAGLTPRYAWDLAKDDAAVESNGGEEICLRFHYISTVPHLEQAEISMYIGRYHAADLIVSDTDEGGAWEYRSVSLKEGDNLFSFRTSSPLVTVDRLELFFPEKK
ncbi:MAG: fibronectin type III-like domain-contianing protein, partial [Clostridia bacterium]|nr:fibronectin type III-like domain-contianing protein [Clostridia bacterium]